MDKYTVFIPCFVEDDVDSIYDTLYSFSINAADRFEADFRSKLEQIEIHPLSCPLNTIYPALETGGVRKALFCQNKYVILYLIDEAARVIMIIAVENAEKDYITRFEENYIKLLETL